MNPQDEALKKLMMHSITRTDLDEKPERPMMPSEEKALLGKFSAPNFEDEFHLAIIKEKEEPGRLFSRRSFEKFLHMLRLYVGGRVLGNFEKTKQSPEVVYISIKVEHITREEYNKRMKD